MYKFKIPIGDPSKDGHNQCEYITIESNKSEQEIKEAYNKSCELTGLVFTSNKEVIVDGKALTWRDKEYKDRCICTEYESYDSSDLAKEILNKYNIDGNIDGDSDILVEIFLNFIKISLPDFEYKFINDDIPVLGLTIGYGLFE